MKIRMKIYMFAALLAAFAPIAEAQTESPVSVVSNELKKKGNELYIDAVIKINGDQISTRRFLTLTPVLESGSQKMGLPSVLVNGRIRNKVYNREVALNNTDEEYFAVVNAKKNPDASVSYKMTIPYESWMKDARFVLAQDLCGCGKEKPGEPLLIADKVDGFYQVQPFLVYIRPEVESEKHRVEESSAFIECRVDKYNILNDFRGNANELAKIDNSINLVVDDKNVSLEGITLKGFASPEASFEHNRILAGNRVKSLAEYVGKKHNLAENLFTLENGIEDWDGLKAYAEADMNIPSRKEVLDIINSNAGPDKKQDELETLNGGEPYKYIYRTIYPKLRRTDYKVKYLVREFSLEEARKIIKTNPKQLSLDEMYAVANSYPLGSDAYNEVFEIAVRTFSNDPVANLNAANVALSKRDLDAAARYLAKADNSPVAIHARGVLALLQDNLDEAERLLNQAKAAGIEDASANLEELRKKRADL